MAKEETAKITIHVQPNSRQDRITGFRADVLYVRIAAPPVEGKANEALIKLLSKRLGLSKSHFNIDRGSTGRLKTITVGGINREQALKMLSQSD